LFYSACAHLIINVGRYTHDEGRTMRPPASGVAPGRPEVSYGLCLPTTATSFSWGFFLFIHRHSSSPLCLYYKIIRDCCCVFLNLRCPRPCETKIRDGFSSNGFSINATALYNIIPSSPVIKLSYHIVWKNANLLWGKTKKSAGQR